MPVVKLRSWLLSTVFALSLAASILLSVAVPNQAQSTQAPSKRDVLAEVRALAQEDVENDRDRRTSLAISMYGDSNPALTIPEIRQAYDEEYDKQLAAKNRDPREIFSSERGLMVAALAGLVGLLVGIARETVSKWVNSFFKAIDDWIYARYSGTQLFRGVALRRYRQALFDKYKDLHIPFRRDDAPLDMSEVYVPLKVSGRKDIEQIDADDAIATYKRLMVKGPPGSGKSMLLKHIALKYGGNTLVELPQRPVVALLELHRVSDDKLTEAKLIQALVEVFERNAFPNAERFVRQSLENGTLMLMLDGLDEVNSAARSTVSRVIRDLLDRYEDCRAVITCRKKCTEMSLAALLGRR